MKCKIKLDIPSGSSRAFLVMSQILYRKERSVLCIRPWGNLQCHEKICRKHSNVLRPFPFFKSASIVYVIYKHTLDSSQAHVEHFIGLNIFMEFTVFHNSPQHSWEIVQMYPKSHVRFVSAVASIPASNVTAAATKISSHEPHPRGFTSVS